MIKIYCQIEDEPITMYVDTMTDAEAIYRLSNSFMAFRVNEFDENPEYNDENNITELIASKAGRC